jgi:tRNA A-37 threonylcarbamoyl transferase component Bud32/outer membrane protein assembly factor BamB
MTPPEPAPETPPPESASELACILDAYLADLRAGQAPDHAALLAGHPELAAQLESCLAALDFIHRAERPDSTMPPTLGDFRIIREIGRGAWGVVYEAEQVSLKRRVALKVLRFGGPADREAMERFQREAETVAQLHHTNIIPIFAVGRENGVHFFAMQLIAGRSLAAVAAEAKEKRQPLDAKTVAGWGVQAAEALAHAHARGVVHRDVKPSNLLLDGEGIVWLADFGLARRHDETTMTLAGVPVGTPLYMSPEQAAAAQQPVDARSDVYSLGATLYELATGRPVFEAQTREELYRQIAEVEPAPPRSVRRDLPRDLETVLLKCLAKEPAQRYPTARELADELRRVVNGDPVKARRAGLLRRAVRWARRQRVGAGRAALAAVLATLCVVGAVVYNLTSEAPPAPPPSSVRIQLRTDGPALKLERLDGRGEPVGEPINVGPIALAAALTPGWHRLRLTAPGRLPEEQQLLVEEGHERSYTLALAESPPLDVPDVNEFVFLSTGNRADVLVLSPSLRLVDGTTGRERWRDPKLWWAKFARRDVFEDNRSGPERSLGEVPGRSGSVIPAADLDGDGISDFVLPSPASETVRWEGTPQLMAVSGKDGTILWRTGDPDRVFPPLRTGPMSAWPFLTGTVLVGNFSAGPLFGLAPLQTLSDHPNVYSDLKLRARVLGTPQFAQVDGESTPAVVVAFEANENLVVTSKGRYQWPDRNVIWVEAFSGRTGRSLWRTTVADVLWGTSTSDSWYPHPLRNSQPAVLLTTLSERPVFVVYARSHLMAIDVGTGRSLWNAPAVFEVGHARLGVATNYRGSGRAAVLTFGVAYVKNTGGILAHWLDTGERIPLDMTFGDANAADTRKLNTGEPIRLDIKKPSNIYDGGLSAVEVCVLADGSIFHVVSSTRSDEDRFEAVAYGAPGVPLWRTDLSRLAKSPAGQFRALAPMGDAVPDVLTAAFLYPNKEEKAPNRCPVFVALNRGSDGRTLAARRFSVPAGRGSDELLFWPTGEPRCVVKVGDSAWNDVPNATLWSPCAGRVDELGIIRMGTVLDCNGDGIPDLAVLFDAHAPGDRWRKDLLSIFRGTPLYQWRRVGVWQQELSVGREKTNDRAGPELKGRDRGPYPNEFGVSPFVAPPLPDGDLDGDGVPDVLTFRSLPGEPLPGPAGGGVLSAYSGADGHRLWSVRLENSRDERGVVQRGLGICWFLGCRILEKGGRPCVIAALGDGSPANVLLVLDGASGKVLRKWEGPEVEEWARCRPVFADVNGGGKLAILGYVYDGWDGPRKFDRPADRFRIALDVQTGEVFRSGGDQKAVGAAADWLPAEKPSKDLIHSPGADLTTLLQPATAGGERTFRDVPIEEEEGPSALPLPWVAPGRAALREAAAVGGACLAVLFAFALARRWRMVAGLTLCFLVPPLLALTVLLDKDAKLFPAGAFPRGAGEPFSWQGWYLVWPYVMTRWGPLSAGTILNPAVWMGCWTAAVSGQALLCRLGARRFGAGWIVLGCLALLVKENWAAPERYPAFVLCVVLGGSILFFSLILAFAFAQKPEKGKAP